MTRGALTIPALFTKPIETVDAADVAELIGWPESLTVEFKETLPGKEGRQDGWFRGGSVDAYARDKLFREVIALANTSGGHLIVGVAEQEGASPTGAAIVPIPRCFELAERLARAAQQSTRPFSCSLRGGNRRG